MGIYFCLTWADAVNVIADPREATVVEGTMFVLHKLLEPIFVQLLVLYVIRLVFFCR